MQKFKISTLLLLISIIFMLIGLATAQCEVLPEEVFFSTEEDFFAFSESLIEENHKIISDGDLLNAAGEVYKTNYELLRRLWAGYDLGLDAADVIDIEEGFVVFSTELDDPWGRFTAGDLLATNGAILPNLALLAQFDIPSASYLLQVPADIEPYRNLFSSIVLGRVFIWQDLGLDAIHFTGNRDSIIEFLDIVEELGREFWVDNPGLILDHLKYFKIDILFSTEGTPPLLSKEKPRFLDGDLLYALDANIVFGSELLPPSVPAGIPDRGVDFGLDAVTLNIIDNENLIRFSTEILYKGELNFTDGDVLVQGGVVAFQNNELIKDFDPKVAELGLDALSFYFYQR